MARLFILALAVVLAAAASVSAEGGKVLELTEETFDSTIAENSLTLVEFFAPWCGHCKALAPEYAAAAEQLEGAGAGALASVDCTEEKALCEKYSVRGFPTLKLFRADGGEPSDFDQARKADAIVKYMKKQSQPAVTELESRDAVAGFAEGESVKVVLFHEAGADVSAFASVASALRNEYSFASVASGGDAKVTVFRNFDEGDVDFAGAALDSAEFGDELTAFVKAQSFPVVGEIGPDNYAKYLERGFPFVWAFLDLSDDASEAQLETLAAVGKDYRESLSFVKLDGVKWGEHAKSFGLTGATPGVVIEDRDRKKNYIFPEGDELTVEALSAFVAGYADGSLAPNVKSEPVPEDNTAPVTVVVGTTFEDIVLDTGKDVLVEFYAPWCGHCKSLAPKYDELGEKYADDSNIVVAKIDATANDAPADVSGFPTLIFYSAEDNTETEYSGARTADGMAEFIEKNRKSSPAAAGHDEL